MLLCSAGDAVTAKIVEQMGFNGIWVSGFETSARLGLKDDGSITMTEMLNECSKIVNSVNIPVYVDVDTGYGNFPRTVKEFERIGVTGICVEDNLPQKTNSLFGGKQPLEDSLVQCKKLVAGLEVANKLKIIARTEALIRGMGMDEAIARANQYKLMGADYIMVHTRDTTGQEAFEIPKLFNGKLVIVPTKFPQVTTTDLYHAGYHMIIWANHTERLKIKAVRDGLKMMLDADCPLPVEESMSCTLNELKGLTE